MTLGAGTFYWVKFNNRADSGQQFLDNRFSRRTTFTIEEDKWLELPIAGFHDRLRLFSFAQVEGQRGQYIADREFLYAIDYQILNESSDLLLEKKYHMRSFFPDEIITENGEILEPKFIAQQKAPITAGRFFDVDLATLDQPRKLRLKIASQDPAIGKVLVRALLRGRLSPAKARLRWTRLSEEKKIKVTRQYIYPHTLLSEPEIESRLSQRWYPTAPSDTGYEAQTLYSYRTDDDELAYEDAPLRIGRPFGGDLLLTALIPKTAKYRLFFQSANENVLSPVTVVIRHWNPGPRIATEETIRLDSANPVIERQFDKGMIELRAPLALRVAITSPLIDTEHINKVYSLSAYALDADKPVIYDVSKTSRAAADFRVNIRQSLGYSGLSKTEHEARLSTTDTVPALAATLAPRYEVLDENNRVVLRGVLDIAPLLSPYGQLVGHNARYKVSEATSLYLPLPPGAARVAIYGLPTQFTYAYTRPADLVLSRVIPRDYRSWEHLGGRAPSWFLLTPANDLELALGSRRNRLYSQPQPPTVNEQINAGFFSVQEIQPRGDAWGKHIVASLAYDKQPRIGADKLFFADLKPDSRITLTAPPGIDNVAPSLLFQRDSAVPKTVPISIDGKLIDHFPIQGRTGLIRLPPVAAGAHTIHIGGGNDTRWLINQCACRYSHQRRFAYKLVNRGIEYDIRKTGTENEIFTLLVYTDVQGAAADISTELIGFSRDKRPSKGWSFQHINFKVRPDSDADGGFELDFGGNPVGNPERLFISLGADVPPGNYRLRVRQTAGAEALVQLYTLQGTSEVSRFFTEPF